MSDDLSAIIDGGTDAWKQRPEEMRVIFDAFDGKDGQHDGFLHPEAFEQMSAAPLSRRAAGAAERTKKKESE